MMLRALRSDDESRMRAVGGSLIDDRRLAPRSESSRNGDDGGKDGGRGIGTIMPRAEAGSKSLSLAGSL